MRTRLIRILLAGCAAAAAVALCGNQAFAAGGTVSITNANTTITANGLRDQLQFGPNAGSPNTLTTDNVSGGCLGQISAGAVLQLTGKFTVSPPNITIS